jgi:hypothetical protein
MTDRIQATKTDSTRLSGFSLKKWEYFGKIPKLTRARRTSETGN